MKLLILILFTLPLLADPENPLPTAHPIDQLFNAPLKPSPGKILIQNTKDISFNGPKNQLNLKGQSSLQTDNLTLTSQDGLIATFSKKNNQLKTFTASKDVRIKAIHNKEEYLIFGGKATYTQLNQNSATLTLKGPKLRFISPQLNSTSNDKNASVSIIIKENKVTQIKPSPKGWTTTGKVPKTR